MLFFSSSHSHSVHSLSQAHIFQWWWLQAQRILGYLSIKWNIIWVAFGWWLGNDYRKLSIPHGIMKTETISMWNRYTEEAKRLYNLKFIVCLFGSRVFDVSPPNNKTALSHLMRKSNSFSFKWLNYNNTRASFNFAHNLIRSNRMLKTEPKTNIEFITCYLSLTIKLTNEYELDSLSGEWDESFTPVF